MSEWAFPAVICCACGGDTAIVNTRGRAGRDVVHRQRQCRSCGATVSTFESRQNPANTRRVEKAIERIEGALEMLGQLKAELKR
jgi:transcriptional regulator NrdR family protein